MQYLKEFKIFEKLNFPMSEDLQFAIKKIFGEYVTAPDLYQSDIRTWQNLEWDNTPFLGNLSDSLRKDLRAEFKQRTESQQMFDRVVNLANDYGNSLCIEMGWNFLNCMERYKKNPICTQILYFLSNQEVYDWQPLWEEIDL